MDDSIEYSFGGGREMVGPDRLKELIQQLGFKGEPSLLRLSNKSFSFEAAELLAPVISKFQFLKIANISDIIAGRPEEEALKTLSVISEALAGKDLLEVNVSDNALGVKGVDACREILACKKIEVNTIHQYYSIIIEIIFFALFYLSVIPL